MQMLCYGGMISISLSFIGTCSKYRLGVTPESIRRRLVGRCGLLATQFPHFCRGTPRPFYRAWFNYVTCSSSAEFIDSFLKFRTMWLIFSWAPIIFCPCAVLFRLLVRLTETSNVTRCLLCSRNKQQQCRSLCASTSLTVTSPRPSSLIQQQLCMTRVESFGRNAQKRILVNVSFYRKLHKNLSLLLFCSERLWPFPYGRRKQNWRLVGTRKTLRILHFEKSRFTWIQKKIENPPRENVGWFRKNHACWWFPNCR